MRLKKKTTCHTDQPCFFTYLIASSMTRQSWAGAANNEGTTIRPVYGGKRNLLIIAEATENDAQYRQSQLSRRGLAGFVIFVQKLPPLPLGDGRVQRSWPFEFTLSSSFSVNPNLPTNEAISSLKRTCHERSRCFSEKISEKKWSQKSLCKPNQ